MCAVDSHGWSAGIPMVVVSGHASVCISVGRLASRYYIKAKICNHKNQNWPWSAIFIKISTETYRKSENGNHHSTSWYVISSDRYLLLQQFFSCCLLIQLSTGIASSKHLASTKSINSLHILLYLLLKQVSALVSQSSGSFSWLVLTHKRPFMRTRTCLTPARTQTWCLQTLVLLDLLQVCNM